MDIDCSISGWCFVGFSSPSFIGVCLTNKNCIYLRCTRWRFDGCMHCKMTTATKLTYPSFHIVTFFFFFFFLVEKKYLRSTLWTNLKYARDYFLSSPWGPYTSPCTLRTRTHSSVVEHLYPLINTFPFLLLLAPGNHQAFLSQYDFYFLFFRRHIKWDHAVFVFPISLQIISFRFIHVVSNVKISFLKAITFCVYVCLTFSWSIHPSIDGH